MFAGHLGAALVIGRAERRLNVGVFVVAALFLDLLLWGLVLLGWESASIPANFASTHQPVFVFPYSHGLLAALLWSGLGAAVVRLGDPECKPRAALLVGAAVLSHWVLDALVHVPELPLTGPQSMKLGFGLWQSPPVGLGLEALLVVVGLVLYLPGAQLSRVRKAGLATLVLVVMVFTVLGMTLAPPPPSAAAMAASSLLTLLVVCGLAGWLGRLPRGQARLGR